jgi:hypothetical protein
MHMQENIPHCFLMLHACWSIRCMARGVWILLAVQILHADYGNAVDQANLYWANWNNV